MWRSLLFVPILNARLVEGAARRSADAIVLDLEAAVPLERKPEARAVLAETIAALKGEGAEVAVRVNPLGEGGAAEIALAAEADLIVLPHACPDSTAEAAALAGATPLVPILESPRAVIEALAIAEAAPSVVGLALGVEDYAAAMGAPPTVTLLTHAAFQVIQAARAAGQQPLVLPDTIADFQDLDRFEAAATTARAMGASGGFAIHPRQVEILNRVFTPTPDEIAAAKAVLAAAEAARAEGRAIAVHDGQMIDGPVEARARAILARG